MVVAQGKVRAIQNVWMMMAFLFGIYILSPKAFDLDGPRFNPQIIEGFQIPFFP